ncbi:NAD(+)/NADH kinase [Petralouisia muris]|jgi:NAD+ kinase|uniref:NAD(+)/NADH kinase n=1 Tax=Petralouisia muris TaxID=3032872 RepID=A0AC61RU97_9FIRM|nr:NAD(+)/NADH kinase [Petralouisia muris]TGY95461.1 NAD(+)/NADH kinase [Petralouisia muris]
MKHFYIIANPARDTQLELTGKIQKFVTAKGGTCGYQANRELEGIPFDRKQIPEDTECILVVGGDGTLLRAARNIAERNVPLIGINTGHLGYLCELEADTAIAGVEHLLAEKGYTIERRMQLSGCCITRAGREQERTALNDIVIHRCGRLQVVDLIISVNGEYLNTYRADGIILATPTGSTGYSMSCGGPIVDPKASLLLITPISPHTLNAKSIVLDAEDEITIEVAKRSTEQEEELEVSFDGDHVGMLRAGEKITVKKAHICTRILKLSQLSFLERLRKKLQGYG